MPIKLSTPPTTDLLAAAYDKHLDAMRAIADGDVLPRVNFDLATAASIALGAQPALLKLRAQVHAQLPETSVKCIDELDSIAHAAQYAHMQSLVAPTTDRTAALVELAKPLRKQLLADAAAASAREFVDPAALEEIPRGGGHLDLARALLGLSVLFRASWQRVQGRSAVTEKELDEAARIG